MELSQGLLRDYAQVYLVTGGEHNGGLASTEILTHGASAWVTVDTGALPSSRRAVRAATLDNRVLLTGEGTIRKRA